MLWQGSTIAESRKHPVPAIVSTPSKPAAARANAPEAAPAGRFFSPTPPLAALTLPAGSLSPDDEALMTEAIALQRLATGTDLELNTQQWSALAAATLEIQAIRQEYEASIATATLVSPGRYRVEVPVYAAAGDALRTKFHAELLEQLGEADAAEVLTQIGSRLEGHFGGFGVSVQSLDITTDPTGGADGVVTRTTKYWNSVEGREQLTTRRETFFPGREDPTGELWRPFLALVGARS